MRNSPAKQPQAAFSRNDRVQKEVERAETAHRSDLAELWVEALRAIPSEGVEHRFDATGNLLQDTRESIRRFEDW